MTKNRIRKTGVNSTTNEGSAHDSNIEMIY